jgi:hypothetical protein
MKNTAILKAGKTKPTIGTKIEGKNVAAIVYSKIFNKIVINNIHCIQKTTGIKN